MREASVPGYRLSKARKSMKLLTTLAMLGLLLGLLMSGATTVSRTGLSATSVRAYYRGESPAPHTSESDSPALDEITSMSSPRPFDELVEVTHLHLMGGSLMLFLLCHLLSLCQMKENMRMTLYVLSFGSFITTFSLPWAIIYLHPIFAVLFGPSVVLFLASLIVLCVFPVWEMWFAKVQVSAGVAQLAVMKASVSEERKRA